jgi:hypothetical protein
VGSAVPAEGVVVTAADLSQLLIGIAIGAAVAWRLSAVSERFRRARRDLRIARSGIRTLLEMVASRAWDAIKLWILVIVIVAVAIAAWAGGHA